MHQSNLYNDWVHLIHSVHQCVGVGHHPVNIHHVWLQYHLDISLTTGMGVVLSQQEGLYQRTGHWNAVSRHWTGHLDPSIHD